VTASETYPNEEEFFFVGDDEYHTENVLLLARQSSPWEDDIWLLRE
jgi:hypothetical protein